jgi:CRP/FNR family transcriptional regulator
VCALAAVAVRREYHAGETVFLEQDPCAGLFLIESGAVKICRFSKEGREYILHLLQRGDTFNDVAALDGGPNPATAVAHSAAILWRVGRMDLQSIASRYPALAWALVENLARRARHLVGVVQDLSMRNVRGRLARLLLEQAQDQGEAEVDRLLTQEEMASRLGTVREVVGRALRDLAAEGVIEFDRHRIIILDPDRLAGEAAV